jgi:hypothetical protein
LTKAVDKVRRPVASADRPSGIAWPGFAAADTASGIGPWIDCAGSPRSCPAGLGASRLRAPDRVSLDAGAVVPGTGLDLRMAASRDELVNAAKTAETGSKMRSIAFSVGLDSIPDTRTTASSHGLGETVGAGHAIKSRDFAGRYNRPLASSPRCFTVCLDASLRQSRFMPNYNGF